MIFRLFILVCSHFVHAFEKSEHKRINFNFHHIDPYIYLKINCHSFQLLHQHVVILVIIIDDEVSSLIDTGMTVSCSYQPYLHTCHDEWCICMSVMVKVLHGNTVCPPAIFWYFHSLNAAKLPLLHTVLMQLIELETTNLSKSYIKCRQ